MTLYRGNPADFPVGELIQETMILLRRAPAHPYSVTVASEMEETHKQLRVTPYGPHVVENPLFTIEPEIDALLRKGATWLRLEGVRAAGDAAPYENLAFQLEEVLRRLTASRVPADRVL